MFVHSTRPLNKIGSPLEKKVLAANVPIRKSMYKEACETEIGRIMFIARAFSSSW